MDGVDCWSFVSLNQRVTFLVLRSTYLVFILNHIVFYFGGEVGVGLGSQNSCTTPTKGEGKNGHYYILYRAGRWVFEAKLTSHWSINIKLGCINNKHIGGTCFSTRPLFCKYYEMKHVVKRPRILLHCTFDVMWHLNWCAILIRVALTTCRVLASVSWHIL